MANVWGMYALPLLIVITLCSPNAGRNGGMHMCFPLDASLCGPFILYFAGLCGAQVAAYQRCGAGEGAVMCLWLINTNPSTLLSASTGRDLGAGCTVLLYM